MGRIIAFACGCALLVGFFLPWIEVGGLGQIKASGLEILKQEQLPDRFRIMLLMCPICGVLLVASAFGKKLLTALAAFFIGAGVLGYPLYYIFKFLRQTTGLGLWLVIGAGIVSFVYGISALLAMGEEPDEPGAGTDV